MDPTNKQDDLLSADVLSTRRLMRPSRIVVIDGDADLCQLLTQSLQQDNHAVMTAANGREGLKLAEEEQPDLFMIDVQLDDMDGFEICRRLKAHATLQFSPVV